MMKSAVRVQFILHIAYHHQPSSQSIINLKMKKNAPSKNNNYSIIVAGHVCRALKTFWTWDPQNYGCIISTYPRFCCIRGGEGSSTAPGDLYIVNFLFGSSCAKIANCMAISYKSCGWCLSPIGHNKDVINEKLCTRIAMHHDWQVIPIILIGNEYQSSWHFIWSGSSLHASPIDPSWSSCYKWKCTIHHANLNQPFHFFPNQKKCPE
jgi:hypothetical protein